MRRPGMPEALSVMRMRRDVGGEICKAFALKSLTWLTVSIVLPKTVVFQRKLDRAVPSLHSMRQEGLSEKANRRFYTHIEIRNPQSHESKEHGDDVERIGSLLERSPFHNPTLNPGFRLVPGLLFCQSKYQYRVGEDNEPNYP